MIAFIAPYLGLKRTADRVVEKYGFPVSTYLGNLNEGLEIAERLGSSGRSIIVSRGGTAKLIGDHLPTQVIDIEVSHLDLMKILSPYISNPEVSLGIVGFKSLLKPARQVTETLGINARFYRIHDEGEVFQKIEDIRKDKIDVIVGDVISVRIAEKYGLAYHLIESSEESVKTAIEKALSIMTNVQREMEELGKTRAIFDSVNDGIISLDKTLKIDQFNSQAREYLMGYSRKGTLKGRSILDFVKDSNIPEVLKNQEKSEGRLFRIGDNPFVFNSTPVIVDGETEAVVTVFQPVSKLQKIESKVRSQLHKKGLTARYHFDDIISIAPSMLNSLKHAKQYSSTLSNILITGETGTGKELLAQSIHNASPVSDGPFVAVNCSALSATLLESELFGYVGGAFTGALRGGKTGLFELAHGGTIFLDEINSMDFQLQARLLRVLQEHEIMRLGDEKVIPVSVRVICASNSDLKEEVRKGHLRKDLYYRMSVLEIEIPTLKNRRDDIISLFQFFSLQICRRRKTPVPEIVLSKDFRKRLLNYSWPGNVRELENLVEKYLTLGQIEDRARVEEILISYLTDPGDSCEDPVTEGSLKEIEGRIINAVLEEENGNITRTAARLEIDRNTLKRKLKEN